jgi:ABC-type glycerol-3-phosphate transport system substrate-binding protein
MFTGLSEQQIKRIEYAESLDKFIQEEPESIDHIFPEAMELVKHGGVVKGIPIYWGRETMLYNKSIFDAAAINYPKDDWSISDMISIAEAIKEYSSKQEGDPIIPIGVDGGDIFFYYYMIALMGGQLYKIDGNELIPTISTDPNTVSALSLIKELVKNELIYI